MAEETATIPTVNIDVATDLITPRLEALLFADYAATTNDKKGVLCGIFDRVFIVPGSENIVAFFLFIRTAEAIGGVQITIIGPDGTPVAAGTSRDAPMISKELSDLPPPRHVQVVQQMALRLNREGIYWFDVSYKGQSLGRAPLIVMARTEEA